MDVRSRSALLAAACLLPALEITPATILARAPSPAAPAGAPLVASFIPACESRPPHATFLAAEGVPPRPPRPRDAEVSVFLAGQSPPANPVVLGRLVVRAASRRSDFRHLLDHARRAARRHGGQALVEVTPLADPGARDPLVVTATVVGW